MQFNAYLPATQLSSFIHIYLEANANNGAGEYALFPNGFSGIFFNFGSPGTIILRERIQTPPVSIYGQIDRHFSITHPEHFYSIGVLFKPAALSKLLKIDMNEFANMAFDGTLINNELGVLHTRMVEATGINSKVALLDQFFVNSFEAAAPSVGIADHALRVMDLYRGIPMDDLAKEVGVSQRYLERQFGKAVGVSPKTYSLIQRFKRIEQELRDSSSASWSDLRFAHHFYDQNHFIKDFKRFTGRTPSTYLLENLDMARSYLVR
jgi:AraC-like DNA-binding protein